MIRVDLRADLREVDALLRGIKNGTPTVMSRSINRVLTPLRATAARAIADDTRLPVRVARGALTIRRAKSSRLVGSVDASGKRVALIEFTARPTKAGVSYDLGRGRKVAQGTFIPASPPLSKDFTRRGVFRRLGKPRLPVVFLRGPSLPRVFVQRKITDALRAVANTRMRREIQAQIKALLSGFAPPR